VKVPDMARGALATPSAVRPSRPEKRHQADFLNSFSGCHLKYAEVYKS
jgi:hypothetical protein